jgi:hypothetical protein
MTEISQQESTELPNLTGLVVKYSAAAESQFDELISAAATADLRSNGFFNCRGRQTTETGSLDSIPTSLQAWHDTRSAIYTVRC